MLASLARALAQFDDPAFKRVFWRGFLGALAIYLVLAFGTWAVLSHTTFFENGWLEWSVHLLGGLAAFILPLFLFPAMAGLIIAAFGDEIARADAQRPLRRFSLRLRDRHAHASASPSNSRSASARISSAASP